MRQYKRLGGDKRIGKYTEWDRRNENYCIYCEDFAETRDHLPSKIFLLEPYPSNLPTIPACNSCNNGFFTDEPYVASYINIFREKLDSNFHNEKVQKTLKHDRKLKELLDSQIAIVDDKIHFYFDKDRFENIIIKLAKGLAAYDFDYLALDSEPTLEYGWSFDLDDNDIEKFNNIPPLEIISEAGSRVLNRIIVASNPIDGETILFLDWEEVQEGMYRYLVAFDEDSNIIVKLSICELLFCVIKF